MDERPLGRAVALALFRLSEMWEGLSKSCLPPTSEHHLIISPEDYPVSCHRRICTTEAVPSDERGHSFPGSLKRATSRWRLNE